MGWFFASKGLAMKQNKDEYRVPTFLQPANRFGKKTTAWISAELNFYRIHVLVFIFIPLIASAIFWASNEDVKVPFIDCLFVCFSAMTVTGLVSFNISTATVWQQAILYILMWIGNISAVSITMISVRRHFFRVKFDKVIKNNAAARKRAHDIEQAHHLERKKDMIRLRKLVGLRGKNRHQHDVGNGLSPSSTASTERLAEAELEAERMQKKKKKEDKKKRKGPLRADMIVRVDQPAVLINGHGLPSSVRDSGRRSIEEKEMKQRDEERPGGPLGSILNTPEQSSFPTVPAGDHHTIRISSASQSPSLARAKLRSLGDDAKLCDSPGEIRQSDYYGPGPSALSKSWSFRLGGEGSVETSEVTAGGVDGEAAEVTGNLSFSVLPRIDQGRATHFDENAVASSFMRRRGSDPSGLERERMRRGFESAVNPPISRGNRTHGQLRGGTPGANGEDRMPRSQTIEFAEPPRVAPSDRLRFQDQHPERGYTTGILPTSGIGLPRQRTIDRTYSTSGFAPAVLTRTTTMNAKERGFGGFPTPFEIAGQVLSKVLPRAQERLMRSTTMPLTSTIASTHAYSTGTGTGYEASAKTAPYLSFDVNVTGNSMFHSLTEAQRDELGGVEYRALDFLAKIVPVFFFGVNFFMVLLVAPYLASSAFDKYRPVFESQDPHVPNTTWFWLFQTISAYSNSGMSLIDSSMTEMADAYFLLIPTAILILAGNTAFPIFLRFWVWICSLCVPSDSRSYETMRFILDHPRRCFIYLFPSGQTWFLLLIVCGLTATDWVAFEVLDINNPQLDAMPVPQRIFDGLFQSIAVRAGGFQVVSLLEIAPAVQFLYVVMMYISAYPIALSVRSTNVYEERSLGVFTEKDAGNEADNLPDSSGPRNWGSYLAAHARRQLAFDMWWLGFALWLVCIIERTQIQDASSDGWFTVFSCLFELTSAYGTVGLSTGTPYDSFSLSGRFRTLSKLVVIATMIRGRHRGLPVAIDRSILLPNDLDEQDAAEEAWSMIDAERTKSMEVFRTGSISFPVPFHNPMQDSALSGDYKEGPPSPSDRSPLNFHPDHQSHHGFLHPHEAHRILPSEGTIRLDAIREDKGLSAHTGEDHLSKDALFLKQAAATSQSESSLESGNNSGSLKGKEKENEATCPSIDQANGEGASPEMDMEDNAKEAELEKRYGSSAPHLMEPAAKVEIAKQE